MLMRRAIVGDSCWIKQEQEARKIGGQEFLSLVEDPFASSRNLGLPPLTRIFSLRVTLQHLGPFFGLGNGAFRFERFGAQFGSHLHQNR
jgi:hypothetical protein